MEVPAVSGQNHVLLDLVLTVCDYLVSVSSVHRTICCVFATHIILFSSKEFTEEQTQCYASKAKGTQCYATTAKGKQTNQCGSW